MNLNTLGKYIPLLYKSKNIESRMIFNNKLNLEALKIIINSKVSEETIIKVKEILNKRNFKCFKFIK